MDYVAWLYQLTPSPPLLLLIIAAVALLQCLALVGLVVPGLLLMTAVASLAGHQDLAVPLVLLVAFVGALIADGLSFALGHTQRERIHRLWPFTHRPEWLARGARFFQRYGSLSVIFARFVGPVRPIVPMIAGMLHMPTARFAWASLVSALLWTPTYVLPGYLLGHTWQQLLTVPPGLPRWLLSLAALILMLGLSFSWLRHQLTHEGRWYQALARLAQRRGWSRRVWASLRASRPRAGVPLGSMTLLILSLAALSLWTLLVLQAEGPLPMDRQVQALFALVEIPLLDTLAQGLAQTSDRYGVIALVLPWGAWLLWARHVSAFAHFATALIGIATANTLFKHLADRERPVTPDLLLDSMAYPSSHTSAAVVLFGLASAFLAQELPPHKRVHAYWATIALCVPIALSQLVLGVNWASDLVGGALLGLATCALVHISYHRFSHRPLKPAPWGRLVIASLLLLAARIAWLPPA
ncbi:bifunctional DedA family/phosphatase PAP2 family protein [Halomonas campisalis]|uniref:Bifunctional DedA family/phosphatase PAP2 family protein n=1 Tax=Billgrantia campisalis TaxID=74661 RepID=A0ABS9P8H2_9GAMM|nr:bifunctional DedA family/phosphatase PAP2 family protein [Halomonas campisalis]MCG6657926.1 bifunctional DedA family/phosphatase PAP2 family protein [Halomonas campisalis]MDR5863549.1 bifunctional DedA family/phosphatase PAP2 family protein [Halomonas campisalis]